MTLLRSGYSGRQKDSSPSFSDRRPRPGGDTGSAERLLGKAHERSQQYAEEQKALVSKTAVLRAQPEKADNRAVGVDSFSVSLRKYSRAKKLTEWMRNELVKRIEVFHAERANGEHRQKICIHYNRVDTIGIPALSAISDCKAQMQTRKDMVVTYPSLQDAI